MRTPRATYRLQFRDGMDFERATRILPYLRKLGVSHLYASPLFTATSGSRHGYDVTNHNEIDPALGGREGFERLSHALRQDGLGLILDIVPNHMAASLENRWWRDVVEWGQQSRFQRHFDIDWREKLTLPILGRPLHEALEAGELMLKVDRKAGVLALGYFDHLLPLSPSTYGMVLARCAGPLAAALATQAKASTSRTADAMHEQARRLLADGPACARLDGELAGLAPDATFLQDVLAAQPWRLLFWKEARRHLSYRRFFEVTGLVGVRVEDPAVFDEVHELTLELVRSGCVDGLRVDHVDGLADPKSYLQRLRQEIGPDPYLVVEKILARDETLPRDWPVAGTTGYEFIATMADLFTNVDGNTELARLHATSGGCHDFDAEARKAKRLIVSRNFETELTTLVDLAVSAWPVSQQTPDRDGLRAALIELMAAFPIYRTYGDATGMPDTDRALLARLVDEVSAPEPALDADMLSHIMALLVADTDALAAQFRQRFQQLTGPVMAKAVEDTLFYRCNHSIGLNEVGCDPAKVSGAALKVHARLADGMVASPSGMLTTATHDTKRGEDARARLYALSEAPHAWGAAVDRWRTRNSSLVTKAEDGRAPEPSVEWLLYQALAGAWPEGRVDAASIAGLSERLQPYVEKALREAKLRTDWAEVNEAYEHAVKAYAARMLAPENQSFLADFAETLGPFVQAGRVNSLAQSLIKLTAPGVPDIYQGTEAQDFSLVDPDNRRAVDFELLERLLSSSAGRPLRDLAPHAAKQQLIARCLALRADHERLFAQGAYVPLEISGERRDHLFAFMRSLDSDVAVVVIARQLFDLCREGRPWGDAAFWSDTRVHLAGPLSRSVNLLGASRPPTGMELRVRDLLQEFPLALLV